MIPSLIEAALRALVVAIVVWAGLRVFRVHNVLAQKVAWGLVLASAVAMPLMMRWQWLPASAQLLVTTRAWQRSGEPTQAALAAPYSAVPANRADATRLAVPREAEPAAGGDRFPAPTISTSEFNPSVDARPEAASFSNESVSPASNARLFRLATLGGILYFAVCAALFLRLMYGVCTAVKLWLSAEPVSPEPGLLVDSDLRLRASGAVFSPVTIGSGVILPADFVEWDAEKLRIVLAHERSHIRQWDFYLQLLAGVYSALFWFSPLGWWLKHKLSDLGEAIGDRAGVEQAACRASYARVLLEFAAMPRPTLTGVAMARSSNLSHRIERLLNDTSFRKAFAGSRRRALLTALLIPVALFAGTALIRVEAAGNGRGGQTAPPAAPATAPKAPALPEAPPGAVGGEALPVEAPEPPPAQNQVEPGGPPTPAMPPAPMDPGVPPPPGGQGPAAIPQGMGPVPPAPQAYGEIHDDADKHATITAQQDSSASRADADDEKRAEFTSRHHGYSYSTSSNGDTWVLVTDPSESFTFSGDGLGSTREAIEKARKMTHGKFLLFIHGGKSYVVDDQGLIDQIQAMYKPMEALGVQQEKLGKEQEALGRQQEELGRRQEKASIPTPDISKEMAELNESVAKLEAKKGSTISQEELAELEARIGELQGRLGGLQGEIGARQGEFGAQQGKLGEQQGKLGAEQGRLGAQQGKIAAEADHAVRGIIAESLHNGKARPVE